MVLHNMKSSTSPRLVLAAALTLAAGCEDDAAPPTAPPAPVPPPEPEPVPPEVTAWIEANSTPFWGSHLSFPHTDIEFLRELVGDAHIVALGENTHGTRDFFEMKARVLRFLVEEMGFNTFGIEATWPEARRIDHYVRTGEGDPEKALSGLYFWTWRTESVLEMIEWMRAHNEAGGDIGFHGFDMQYPGMALHNVLEYLGEVDPESAGTVAAHLECLNRFANDHTGRSPSPRYRDQSDTYRADCGASFEEARELLLRNRETYEAATGEDAFEIALQSLRVAFQYHLSATREQGRDESMAENTVWISNRIGPEGRMVLWAHNYHVSTQPGAQGFYLRQTFGDDMVVVGFSHERGRFTAVGQDGDDYTGFSEFELEAPIAGSYEHYLSSATEPRFVLDLRNRDTSATGSAWLGVSRPFRSIGCCYDPGRPERYQYEQPLVAWFDVIIHYERTTPTVLLPRRIPEPF